MGVFGLIRDFVGIRKDVVETKKAKLDMRRLQDEQKERESQIQRAGLEHVKKYDPKTRKLLKKVKIQEFRERMMCDMDVVKMRRWNLYGCFIGILVALGVISALLYLLWRWF